MAFIKFILQNFHLYHAGLYIAFDYIKTVCMHINSIITRMTKAVKKTHGYDSTAQATAKNTRLVWCWNQLQKRTTLNTAAPYEHLPSTCLPSLTSSASYNAANTPGGSKSKQDPQGSLQIHCRFTLLHFCLHSNSKQRNRYQVGCILIGHPIFAGQPTTDIQAL